MKNKTRVLFHDLKISYLKKFLLDHPEYKYIRHMTACRKINLETNEEIPLPIYSISKEGLGQWNHLLWGRFHKRPSPKEKINSITESVNKYIFYILPILLPLQD